MKVMHILGDPPLYTNCYLLIGDEGNAVIIDPSADPSLFEKAMEEQEVKKLSHILLTHGHHDHVEALGDMRRLHPGVKVYAHEADAEMFNIHANEHYTDFGTITVDDMTFKTYFTPGHTPGSVCIECGDLLFTGDTLFAGDIGRTDFKGGSMDEMKKSLKKLADNVTEDLQVLPGHEEFSTMEQEKKHNPYMQF